MSPARLRLAASVVGAALLLQVSLVLAESEVTVRDSSVVVAAGPRYATGSLSRFFWGTRYRDAWTTPIGVPVLNLQAFAGGLKVLKRSSGRQTKGLDFVGADGRRYTFRSVDKDPRAALAPHLQRTIAADIVQDQISSQHPFGALVADRIEQAAGVLHARPHLFVMPDDPALGAFRKEFAGMLGMLVERPGKHVKEDAIFTGALEVVDGQVIYDRVQASPKDRVDSKGFLAARLVDILLGDWDRHRYQWRWARFEGTDWLPIAEDRDQAFSGLDGFIPSKAHFFIPELVAFREKYPDIVGLHMTAQDPDRRWLVDLEKAAWDSVAASVTARLTDAVIEEAVRRLPPEIYALDGAFLAHALKRRRDRLPEMADKFYRLLARTVEIHATDVDEEVRITQVEGDALEITLADRTQADRPYYRRRFFPDETREIRIRMHAGDDRAIVQGGKKLKMTLRLIGGRGDDTLTYLTPTDGVRFYDQFGNNRITGRARGKIDAKPYQEWVFAEGSERPPREWGTQTVPKLVFGLSSDYGLLIGLGATRYTYGFRKHPYANRFLYGGGFSTKWKYHVAFEAEARRENSRTFFTVETFVSQIQILHFYGFGNNTVKDRDREFFEVDRTVLQIEPAFNRQLSSVLDLSFGLSFRLSATEENRDHFIGTLPNLYGNGTFTELGAFAAVDLDSRDNAGATTRGVTFRVKGWFFPPALDVRSAFGTVEARATTYLTAPVPLMPTLALRAGAKKVWGDFPYFESAFAGGAKSLRGFDVERFAGDASLYGSAELRLRLAESRLLLPGDYGVFGFLDAARVYVQGASPGGWHVGYGGGIWLSFFGRQNTLSLSIGRSREDRLLYINYGFAF